MELGNPAKTRLSESKFFYIGLILAYSVYSFFENNADIRKDSSVFLLIIISLVIIIAAFRGVAKGWWTTGNCGFALGKRFWIVMAITSVIFVVTLDVKKVNLNGIPHLAMIFLYVIASQIILVVLLTNLLNVVLAKRKFFKEDAWIISAGLYLFLQISFEGFWTANIIGLTFLGYAAYLYADTLFPLMIMYVALYAPAAHNLNILILALIFYFAIAGAGKLLERRTALPVATEQLE